MNKVSYKVNISAIFKHTPYQNGIINGGGAFQIDIIRSYRIMKAQKNSYKGIYDEESGITKLSTIFEKKNSEQSLKSTFKIWKSLIVLHYPSTLSWNIMRVH